MTIPIRPAGYIRLAPGPSAAHKLPLISHPLCTGVGVASSTSNRPQTHTANVIFPPLFPSNGIAAPGSSSTGTPVGPAGHSEDIALVRLPTPAHPCLVHQWVANARPCKSTATSGSGLPSLEHPLESSAQSPLALAILLQQPEGGAPTLVCGRTWTIMPAAPWKVTSRHATSKNTSWPPVPFAASSSPNGITGSILDAARWPMPFLLRHLLLLLAHPCKQLTSSTSFPRNSLVLRHVPRGARGVWAQCLARALSSVAIHNTHTAWAELLMLPKAVLCPAPRSGSARRAQATNFTTTRCRRWLDGGDPMAQMVWRWPSDSRWWFESLLVHSGVSSATRRKATGADHKKSRRWLDGERDELWPSQPPSATSPRCSNETIGPTIPLHHSGSWREYSRACSALVAPPLLEASPDIQQKLLAKHPRATAARPGLLGLGPAPVGAVPTSPPTLFPMLSAAFAEAQLLGPAVFAATTFEKLSRRPIVMRCWLTWPLWFIS